MFSLHWVPDDVAAVRPDAPARGDYFPERTLAVWLEKRGLPATVYAFARAGVAPLRDAYRGLIEHLGGVDAVADAQAVTVSRPSIVQGSVAAAVRGEFGDVRFTERTKGGELFVNPLMSVYFCVDAPVLARHNLYLDRLADTVLLRQISTRVEEFREGLPRLRAPRVFPH